MPSGLVVQLLFIGLTDQRPALIPHYKQAKAQQREGKCPPLNPTKGGQR